MANQELNLSHIDLTETPVDLRAGLSDGGYEAQPRGGNMLWYVGGTTAPTDRDDYRTLPAGIPFQFPVGTGSAEIWARAEDAAGVSVARRSVTHHVGFHARSRSHFDASTLATDLRGGLPEGNYRCFVPPGVDLWLYTGAAAPADTDDYWRIGGGSVFAFCAGELTQPTWIRTVTGAAVLHIDEGGPRA